MKKIIVLFIVVYSALNLLNAQESYKNKVTWMGLDFTGAKLFTSGAFANPEAIKDNLLVSWNDIVLKESTKFDVAKFFGIETLSNDLSLVKERNSKIEVEELIVDNPPKDFEEQNVKSIISQYPKADGIGLVLIVESFSKPDNTGTFWATFYDKSTLEILSTKRIQGKASGAGIRNYWANSLYKAMNSYNK